jgi:hypothetical protein
MSRIYWMMTNSINWWEEDWIKIRNQTYSNQFKEMKRNQFINNRKGGNKHLNLLQFLINQVLLIRNLKYLIKSKSQLSNSLLYMNDQTRNRKFHLLITRNDSFSQLFFIENTRVKFLTITIQMLSILHRQKMEMIKIFNR